MDQQVEMPEAGLAEEIESAMADFRSAVGILFDKLGNIRRPTDLQKRLDLDPALAWGVYRAATTPSVLQSGLHMPGGGAMRTFFRSAAAAGLDEGCVAAVEQAFDKFDQIRENNGGLQNGFATLVSDLADADDPRENLRQQRAAFRANGHIWGLQAAAIVNCKVLIPAADARMDLVSVQGMQALKKLRRSVSYRARFIWFSRTVAGEGNSDQTGGTAEPLDLGEDGAEEYNGSGLLVDFCSRPLPLLELDKENRKQWAALVRHRDVGVGGATTFYVGHRERGYYVQSRLESGLDLSTYTKIPGEFLVYEVLVHAESWRRGWKGSSGTTGGEPEPPTGSNTTRKTVFRSRTRPSRLNAQIERLDCRTFRDTLSC